MKDTHNDAGNCPDLYALDKPTSSLLSDTIAKISIKVPQGHFCIQLMGLSPGCSGNFLSHPQALNIKMLCSP